MVFKIKPLTYGQEKNKCNYTTNQLANVPLKKWKVEDCRIASDLACTHLYKHLKNFL